MTVENQKVHIEKAIERARDGLSSRIDELDERLRTKFNFKTIAREHAPQIIVGGAVVGFLIGFGFPKALRKVVAIGIPLAFVGMKLKSARDGATFAEIGDYEI